MTPLWPRIADGRTDVVFEFIQEAGPATSKDGDGTSLIQWCAYYGDVSAIRFLLGNGERLESLGENLGLNGAAFHGHWQLCQFLLENGADVNRPQADTAETPLHSALCRMSPFDHLVVKVLLTHGADPNRATRPAVETGGFMRDSRTRAETPLHRAAAFGSEECVRVLIEAGAALDARDMNGDSPLTWASWYNRPDPILRKLCFGTFSIRPGRQSMEAYLRGKPHPS